MAEVVSEVPDVQTPRFNYPWDEWFDGQMRRLEPGRDFTESISPYSFIANARIRAARHGLRVYAVVREGIVYLRAKTDEE